MVIFASLMVGAAYGQVLEIKPDGQVITHSGPATYLGPGQPSQSLLPVPRGQIRQGPQSPMEALTKASKNAELSPALIEAVAWTESRMNPAARSAKGARGIMQLMPETARQMGVDPDQMEANIDGGARYLRGLLTTFDGDVAKSLAGYNAGPNAVRRYKGVPPYRETEAYVSAIMERLADKALGGDNYEKTK